jgi:hypothetical protein
MKLHMRNALFGVLALPVFPAADAARSTVPVLLQRRW